MAATKRGASAPSGNRQATRGRTRTQKTTSSERGSSQSGSASSRPSSKRSGSSRSAPNKTTAAARSQTESSSTASRNGRPAGSGTLGTVTRIGVPAVTGAAGIAGGILLGRTALKRHKKVLGVPMPTKIDLAGVTRQIGETGKQFGKLAEEIRKGTAEVRNAREKAEKIARVFS